MSSASPDHAAALARDPIALSARLAAFDPVAIDLGTAIALLSNGLDLWAGSIS